ncbi:uncharacterized conserved protein [Hahella chejuensis KCTC 2396]|uniref:Uncharacterized conserved protein n=1 Tax=Hahella chejuensis (strain KCTC 2396) TaxID=349521 RepID=Q2SPL4_HAHCH|nr:DUF2235 domain-containing protein [Hahella chejuensis]ABC27410.1 uncharacterized conserved protein [Hahella chejuensis KCTC 2396]
MGKSIVVCCDGTWNRPESEQDLNCHPTNVLKLVRSITPCHHGAHQVVFYDMGVGVNGLWDRLAGGALGIGLSDNVMDAYRFLANNWSEGDRIYLFGFSRGAYTVRSLAGFIHLFGLLPKYEMKNFPLAYRYYRTQPEEREKLAQAFTARRLIDLVESQNRRVEIEFMGVWDTVGALGAPITGLRTLSRRWVGFHDTQLSDTVKFAVQALAIDELRKPFSPDLWTHHPDASELRRERDNQRILQVWLPGNHCDVGGGYSEAELSDLTLAFMCEQARVHGLYTDPSMVMTTAEEHREMGSLHDEFKGIYSAMGEFCRPIGPQQREESGLELGVNEKIHCCAKVRSDNKGSGLNKGNLYAAFNDHVPLFYPRRCERILVDEATESATLTGTGERCRVLDYSGVGARLEAVGAISEHNRVTVRHPLWGERFAEVKWRNGQEAGLAFAA